MPATEAPQSEFSKESHTEHLESINTSISEDLPSLQKQVLRLAWPVIGENLLETLLY